MSTSSCGRPAPGSIRTPGITSSALRRPRPPCAATGWRSTRWHSGRGCSDVARVDASTDFGRRLRLPVMIAPVGALKIFDPGSGAASRRSRAVRRGPHAEFDVRAGARGDRQGRADALRIYQLYVRGDDAFVEDVISRTIDHGYAAFCLTVDTAHYSRRERDIAKRYVRESRIRATGGDSRRDWNGAHEADQGRV